jgi:DNA invertase Pin-like site-specific DNA recombinase
MTKYIKNKIDDLIKDYHKNKAFIESNGKGGNPTIFLSWLVVDQTISQYKAEQKATVVNKKDELLEKKYFQLKSKNRICRELNIEHSTYHRWLKEIRISILLLAVKHGLIDI